jgi:hypothetical protein
MDFGMMHLKISSLAASDIAKCRNISANEIEEFGF